jgi:hypothetical protein
MINNDPDKCGFLSLDGFLHFIASVTVPDSKATHIIQESISNKKAIAFQYIHTS